MKKITLYSVLCVLFILWGCAVPGGNNNDQLEADWQNYKAAMVQEFDGYCTVEGDIRFESIEKVKEFYNSQYQNRGARTVVKLHNGNYDKWTTGQKKRLSYGVYYAFGTNMNALRTELAQAARDWELLADVKFTDLTGINLGLFTIRPATPTEEALNPLIQAEAFYPRLGKRELIIYRSFFQQTDVIRLHLLRHELGHILGLGHEYIFSAGDPVGSTYYEGTEGVELFNDFDTASIMYNHHWGSYTGNFNLSAGDRQGIRMLYGSSRLRGSNQVPTARNDYIGEIDAWDSMSIYPLRNDSDPDGDRLSIIGVSMKGYVQNYGTSLYLSPPSSEGYYSFIYTISDAQGGISTARISFSVYSDDYYY